MENTVRFATPSWVKQLDHIFPTLPSALLEMIVCEVCLFVISYLLSGYMQSEGLKQRWFAFLA